MGCMSRQPTSNARAREAREGVAGVAGPQSPKGDMPRTPSGKSKWLEEDEMCDEIFLLLSGRAARCRKCGNAVRKKYLNESDLCPDCSGEIPKIRIEDQPSFGGCGYGEDSDTK